MSHLQQICLPHYAYATVSVSVQEEEEENNFVGFVGALSPVNHRGLYQS